MGKLRDEEAGIIRHTLGLDRAKESYRNYFCTHPGASNWDAIQSLVQLGFMQLTSKINDDRDYLFRVTDAGRQALNKTV